MTTDLEGRLREALHEDAQRARLLNPDQPPAPDVVSMSENPLRARTHGRRVLVAAAAIVVVIAAAVTAITIEDPSRVATTTPTPTTAPPDESCPLTAEVVSEAIGVTGTHPGSEVCEFGTGIGNSASYSDQLDFACTQASLRKAGYSDAVDGLGVDAYSHVEGLGVALVVCNGDHPFEVHVDIIGDQVAAAVALARLVLNG